MFLYLDEILIFGDTEAQHDCAQHGFRFGYEI